MIPTQIAIVIVDSMRLDKHIDTVVRRLQPRSAYRVPFRIKQLAQWLCRYGVRPRLVTTLDSGQYGPGITPDDPEYAWNYFAIALRYQIVQSNFKRGIDRLQCCIDILRAAVRERLPIRSG